MVFLPYLKGMNWPRVVSVMQPGVAEGRKPSETHLDLDSAAMGRLSVASLICSGGVANMRGVRSQIRSDIDSTIGRRMRHRRWMLGMPQQDLADRIGASLEHVKALEGGAHHVLVSELASIAKALEVPVTYFSAAVTGTDPDPSAPGLRPVVMDRPTVWADGWFPLRPEALEARAA